jgi:NAD(P)-dependent dehydrogenase (short-subunit alcohol dehydrogenase family)
MFKKEGFRKYLLNYIPIGGIGLAQDIVGGVICLASEMSNLVTGHILMIYGGWAPIKKVGVKFFQENFFT